jgi:hypothetical protein
MARKYVVAVCASTLCSLVLATSVSVPLGHGREPALRPTINFDLRGSGDPPGYKLISGQASCPQAIQISENWTIPGNSSSIDLPSRTVLSRTEDNANMTKPIASNEEVASNYKKWLKRHNRSHNHHRWEEATGNQIIKKEKMNAFDYKQMLSVYGSGPMTEFGIPAEGEMVSCGFIAVRNMSNGIKARINDTLGILQSVVVGATFFSSNSCLTNASKVQAPTVRTLTLMDMSMLNRTGVQIPVFKDGTDNKVDLTYLKNISTNGTTKMMFFASLQPDGGSINDCVYMDGNVQVDPELNFTQLLFPNATRDMIPPPSMELIFKSLIDSERVENSRRVQKPADLDPYQPALYAYSQNSTDKSASAVIGNASIPVKIQGNSCFAAHGIVEVHGGARKRMDELVVGDKVKVAPNQYSAVFMFTHRTADAISEFVCLTTASGHELFLTPGHYVLSNGKLLVADRVRPGVVLTLGNGRNSTVSRVSRSFAQGLYNPQTIDGRIVVDGIQVSTYTTAMNPSLAHASLAPLRGLYNLLGVTTSLFDDGASHIAGILPIGSSVF